MKNEKKDEVLKEEPKKVEENPQPQVKMRQIIIETDGSSIRLVKAETAGSIELIGILQNLIGFLNQPKK